MRKPSIETDQILLHMIVVAILVLGSDGEISHVHMDTLMHYMIRMDG